MGLFFAMRIYRRVAELESFSAAARDLRLSNAAVSKHIAALEERLQTKLINRTTRRMSLTTDGAAYYERCARILDDVDDTERSLSRASSAPRGRLRVSAPMSFGLMHLGPLLPEVLAQWPELSLDVDFTDRFVDLVEDGVDLAIRITSELPDSATLTVRRLARAQRVVCASPAYLRERGIPEAPEDLARHHCLDYGMSRTPGAWDFVGPGGPLRVQVEGRLRVSNSLVMRDALLAGVGLGRLPSFYVAEELKRKRLRAVLTEFAPAPLSISAVYPRAKHLAPKVRVFVDFLRERFGAAPWALGGTAR
jgi:DNA-binding transcriptional LysR family regulator